jgi:hypothetical protein
VLRHIYFPETLSTKVVITALMRVLSAGTVIRVYENQQVYTMPMISRNCLRTGMWSTDSTVAPIASWATMAAMRMKIAAGFSLSSVASHFSATTLVLFERVSVSWAITSLISGVVGVDVSGVVGVSEEATTTAFLALIEDRESLGTTETVLVDTPAIWEVRARRRDMISELKLKSLRV